ncbi:uncharacterized protein LOC116290589 [Actinia tenebrosa]|uniref:Uncharacterized protein LOC116290589 n=1 Tax=Actinia tenebrosa TaxID=6105 RepID=A0A6P8HAN0_ACTTE|nr:uncharacterized protein LOC116290589 [Actinia tenebrosa]
MAAWRARPLIISVSGATQRRITISPPTRTRLETETIRDRVFKVEEGEEEEIDIYDMEAKEWGFLLREMFGDRLGTGDYGHLTIEHTGMLFRRFRSFSKYSNQGFEALHRLQRQVYTRATNHDAKLPGKSLEDILIHHYAEKLLFFRLCVTNAIECHNEGKPFHFRGCGWKKNICPMLNDDIRWLHLMKDLSASIMGDDYLQYYFDKNSGVKIVEDMIPHAIYNHEEWEAEYGLKMKKHHCMTIGNESKEPPVKKRKSKKCLFSSDNDGTQDTKTDTSPKVIPSKPNGFQLDSPVNSLSSNRNLKLCQSNMMATRCQLANIILPPSKRIGNNDIEIILCPATVPYSDPYSITCIPSKTSLEYSEKLIADLHKSNTANIQGISFRTIGTFHPDHLSVFHKFHQVQEISNDVSFEVQWLNIDDGLDKEDIIKLSSALWDNKPSKVIIAITLAYTLAIDTTSFASLVGERYLDNMTIDVCLNKYMWELKGQNSALATLVVPTLVWTWESANNHQHLKTQIESCITHCQISTTHNLQIIIPVYMASLKHWGIVYVDFSQRQMHFDDGLRKNIPRGLQRSLQHILDAFHEVIPGTNAKWWNNSATFNRLGMPRQDSRDALQNNQGSGSCGIGVILAGRDLMAKGNSAIHNFTWNFGQSRLLRKNLMLKILQWS